MCLYYQRSDLQMPRFLDCRNVFLAVHATNHIWLYSLSGEEVIWPIYSNTTLIVKMLQLLKFRKRIWANLVRMGHTSMYLYVSFRPMYIVSYMYM